MSDITPRLFTIKQLSTYLGMPVSTIYTKKCRGELPANCVVKIDKTVRFDREVIDRWIEKNKC